MIATMGIDIGKNSFNVVGLDQRGDIVMRQKWSRGQIEAPIAYMPPCLIGIEAWLWKASAPPPPRRRSGFPPLWQRLLALRSPAVWPWFKIRNDEFQEFLFLIYLGVDRTYGGRGDCREELR